MEIHEYQQNIKVRDADIRSLMADPRFNAVFALIRSLRNETLDWASSPTIANEPGKQNHSMGSIYAMTSIEHHLVGVAVADEEDD